MPRPPSPISTDHVILALLDEKPMHGYEIHQQIASMPGIKKIWGLKQSLLYAKLEKLKDATLVEDAPDHPEANPARRYFRLTQVGREALNAWVDSPVLRARDIRQEFLAKLIIARRYSNQRALQLLDTQREVCQGWYSSLSEQATPHDASELDDWFVSSYRLFRDENALEWLDEVESWLRKLG